MLKTLLKSGLIVILLAGVFFVGLQYWEKQKNKTAQVAEAPKAAEPVASPILSHVTVQTVGEGALIELGEVPTAAYQFTMAPDFKSLTIDIPAVVLGLATPNMVSPHPFISNIDVTTSMMGTTTVAQAKILFSKEVVAKDRYMNKALYVDVSAKVEATPTPEPTQATKKLSKKSGHKATTKMTQRKASKKATSKSIQAKKIKRTPPPEEFFAPEPESLAPEMVEPVPTPEETVAEAPRADAPKPEGTIPIPQGNGTLDLDKLFADSQADAAAPPSPELPPQEVAPAENPMVASIPPPKTSETFDSTKIVRDLPKIQNISVQGVAGATVVTIGREKKGIKWKILPQRNPSRLNIEFSEAQNQLETQYPAFAGTRVTKVTTEERRGQEFITRVTLYLEGNTVQYEAVSKGNSVVITIP